RSLVHIRAEAGAAWRHAYILGLFAAGAVLGPRMPAAFGQPEDFVNLPTAIVAGLLVGFGTRLGAGCTSGHGVCGLPRLSVRSLAATLAFMASGFLTVFLVRHVVG